MPTVFQYQSAHQELYQLGRAAEERSILLQTYYCIEISQYEAWQLVFTDESYVDKRNTSRLTGWAKSGTRACSSAPFKRGRRSVLYFLLFRHMLMI